MADDGREQKSDPGDAETIAPHDRTSTRGGFRVPSAPPTSGVRYELGPELARGGLGRVTTALDRTLQRRVAVKELHVRTEQGHRRFLREALTTARLQHPAIIPVLDAGAWDTGDPYLVLKLLEGKTLTEELAARTTTEARLALVPNLLAIADALGYAHEQGVVHRDVKPSNIMLGTHGETVLLDWGVAHDPAEPADAPDAGNVDAIVGTARFMSPEQARGEPPTPAFDVYSIGATLASVVSGRLPFAELASREALAKLCAGATAIPALPPEVPDDLAAIIAKATATLPADRYAHAGQLAGDLRKLIAGQLVSARRYTRRQLVARWLRRYRLLVATAAVALAAIAVTMTVAARSVLRERNAAIEGREVARARADQLILAQAWSSLRSDPTATIAWLKAYPPDAPRQDEVLALADEAAGRGVARQVWHAASSPADAVLTTGALIVAYHDGTLIRGDLATGAIRVLGHHDHALLFVRVLGEDVYVLDRAGEILRSTMGRLTHHATIAMPSRASGLHVVPDAGSLKVTFAQDDATLVPLGAGPPVTVGFDDDYLYVDDETDARARYAVRANGELFVLDPDTRRLWKFAPRTRVRSAGDGQSYLAIEPAGRDVVLWLGAADGRPPIELARARTCGPGDNQEMLAEISPGGHAVVLLRCGEISAFDARARRPIPIESPDRVTAFRLSPNGRWLALGRSDGLDLIAIDTMIVRRYASASPVTRAGFSADERWMFTHSGEHGVRVWAIDDGAPATAALADRASPVRLALTTTPNEVAVLRHFSCATWTAPNPSLVPRAEVTVADVRVPDDEHMLWAWTASDDGRTCVFAGKGGRALVVGDRTAALDDAHGLDRCVLAGDASAAFCTTAGELVTLDVATGARTAARRIAGTLRGIARYRGAPIVLVEHADGCSLESFGGEVIARLPGGPGCRDLRADNAAQPGRETALVVGRSGAVEIWTDRGVLSVASETGLVAVSGERGLVAVARDLAIELWDLGSGQRRAGPAPLARSVEHLAWSAHGILAAADEQVVRLWDPDRDRIRVLYAPHISAMVWSGDGGTLFTSDGRHVTAWPIDVARGASAAEVRARLGQLTSAQIVDGRATTPR